MWGHLPSRSSTTAQSIMVLRLFNGPAAVQKVFLRIRDIGGHNRLWARLHLSRSSLFEVIIFCTATAYRFDLSIH